jgi:hypothetical protein
MDFGSWVGMCDVCVVTTHTRMSCVILSKPGGLVWVGGDGLRRKRHKTSSKIIENLDTEYLEM